MRSLAASAPCDFAGKEFGRDAAVMREHHDQLLRLGGCLPLGLALCHELRKGAATTAPPRPRRRILRCICIVMF